MIKVILVGSGGMGNVHYDNYQLIDRVKVVGLVGTSQDSLKAQHWNVPFYTSITEAIKETQADVVDVCTPTFLHFAHVMEALHNEVHVICEKPLALSVKEATEMFEMASKVNKHLYVGQVVQFMKESEYIHELIENGSLGKPLDGYFERLSSIPNWVSGSWMFDKDKAGLIPFDLHIHDLDLIISLFGKPQKVNYTPTYGTHSFPEHFRFMYDIDGINVVAEAAWFNAQIPFTVRWRVYFEYGYVVYDGEVITIYHSEKKTEVIDLRPEVTIETGINVGATSMYLDELEHFVRCIEKDIPTDKVPKEQVLSVLEVLESIQF